MTSGDVEIVPVMKTVVYTYDRMDRATDIAQTVSIGNKEYTHYTYDINGNLTDMYTGLRVPFSAALSPETYSHIHYTYDGRGNNTGVTDSLSQEEIYTYDTLGMVTSVTKRDGTVTRYTYDALGNTVSEIIYANAASTTPLSEKTTVYTSTGAVRSCTLDGSTVTYTYDGAGNMLSETEGETVKTYAYDSRGRRSVYTLSVGNVQKSLAVYTYDAMDRMASVIEGGKTTAYTYDANGNRASQTTGEVSVVYTYNDANLVASMTNTMENAQGEDVVISAFTYTYYADGNMHTKTETMLGSTSSTEYAYDGAGRLVSETKDGTVIAYTYDANGNRVQMNNAGTVTGYTYDRNNRLLSDTTGDATTAYTYDANGNTLSAGNKTYIYNARGQQVGYSDGATAASYAYNPSGLRAAKTVGGATRYFVYNGMNIVYEYDADGVEDTVYYFGLNRTHNSDGEIYVYNAHGDVVQLVKNNAVIVSYTYDAFGNINGTIGESENAFLYCGEYYDAETGTYYLRARYYDPTNGRFTQQDAWAFMDPSDPLSLNLYTYCANNPVMYIDPSGHLTTDQYLSFLWEFGVEGVKLISDRIGGGIWNIVSQVSDTLSTFYQTTNALLSGEITVENLISTIGQGVWDGLSGDIRYLIENYKLFDPELELSNDELKTLAQHTAGAYEELVQIGTIVYGAVKTIQQVKATTTATATPESVCFVAGTLVLTNEGLRSIETIQADDFVVSTDVGFGKDIQLQRVVQTFESQTLELMHVYVSGEEIVTTPSHPFWVPQKGWTDAIQLRAGDILVLVNGDYVVVEKVQHEILEESITVYNLEVEAYHTYYVGQSSLLVHNRCGNVNYMSNQEKNRIMKLVAQDDVPRFSSRQQAEAFIKKYYPDFPQEVAGHRSAQGWHFDSHMINGVVTDHINIYSKKLGINAHIYWDN